MRYATTPSVPCVCAQYHQQAFKVAQRIAGNAADADDALQDAYVKVLRKQHLYDGESPVDRWFMTIVANSAKDLLRRRKMTLSIDVVVGDQGSTHADILPSDERSSLDRAATREMISQLDDVMADDYYAILVDRANGLSYQELSETYGVSKGTVKSRLFARRKKLEKLFPSF